MKNFIKSLAYNYLKKKTSIWHKLSVISYTAGVVAILPPFYESVIEHFLNIDKSTNESLFVYLIGLVLMLAGIQFARKDENFHKHTREEDNIIMTPQIIPLTKKESHNLHMYTGAIHLMASLECKLECVICSENQNLSLGDISGSSVSGRIRRMSAYFNSNSQLERDPIFESINEWKIRNNKFENFSLGTVVFNEPYNASSYGIKLVANAIALMKKENGINEIREESNLKIIEQVFDKMIQDNLSNVFIPVFGLGSGNIPLDFALNSTLQPLKTLLNKNKFNSYSFNIFLGVHKQEHRLALEAKIGEIF